MLICLRKETNEKREEKGGDIVIDSNKRLLSVKEVLDITQTSRNQLYRDLKTGKITAIHFGRNVRFLPEDVEKYEEYKKKSKKVQVWKEKKKNITQQKT